MDAQDTQHLLVSLTEMTVQI
ncbi:hypothetical protein N7463_007473 [Penicillium fimorum]|uniref:Uncharacterized protein n=1 Tax=Penicillium fimorum TaxID=1882269 RepID=A0A9W9XWQ3_9EURO|nr:hypothetical protein N7463_007473 [Penicillium fimorum]